ncbi:MAG TPA: M1 family aminopeptidase, partial [Candidatus Acidoferrales bacterium]|nr:M1 family aminopeptidase [Candidatus Acidoferrales bacterium]
GSDALEYVRRTGSLTIRFKRPLHSGEQLEFAVRYRVDKPTRGAYFTEPDRANPKKPRQLWTQSQDSDARYWFPCVDYPDNKQTSTTTVVVRMGLFALGNGALKERRDEAGTTIFVYRQEIPHPTYLFTLVVGEFSEIAQTGAEVPIFYYVAPGHEADGERSFGATPQMIQTFNDFIGVSYPFARYSQIAVADFIFGGMENTTATTQTDRTLHDERAHLDFSSDPLVSHELAHQWFGDLLTTRDWAHAWLNEGFATYFEAVWYEASRGWDEYAYHIVQMVRNYFAEDDERYRRPVVFNRFVSPIEIFDRHLYEKGGAVLHMLRGTLGHERFRRAIHRYVADNRGGSVETIDLVRAIEHASGRNLRGFFEQWIGRGGYPELEIGYKYDAERKSAIVDVRQKQKVDDENPAFRFDLNVGFLSASHTPSSLMRDAGDAELAGEHRVRLEITRAQESFAIPVSEEPSLVRIDPGAYVLGKFEYKLGTDMLVRILRTEPDIVARIRAAQALAKDGGRNARETLVEALENEPFWGVSIAIARALAQTHAPWAKDALLRGRKHPHPKARRGICEALGAFPRDPNVASALIEMLDDASYFVVADALDSLGKTRDPRAREILTRHLDTPSWRDTIAAGAARGLGALGDAAAVQPLIAATRDDRSDELRRAALGALARLYHRLDERKPSIVEAIVEAFDDDDLLVRLAAVGAAEHLAEAATIPALRRISSLDGDGRIRRDALEAIERIGEAQRTPPELAKLRSEVEELRETVQELRARLDTELPIKA